MDWQLWEAFVFPSGEGEIIEEPSTVRFVEAGILFRHKDGSVASYTRESIESEQVISFDQFLERLQAFETSLLPLLDETFTYRTIETRYEGGWFVQYMPVRCGIPVKPVCFMIHFNADGLIEQLDCPDSAVLDETAPPLTADEVKRLYVEEVPLLPRIVTVEGQACVGYDLTDVPLVDAGEIQWSEPWHEFEDEQKGEHEAVARHLLQTLLPEATFAVEDVWVSEQYEQWMFVRLVDGYPVIGHIEVEVNRRDAVVQEATIDEAVYMSAGSLSTAPLLPESDIREKLERATRVKLTWKYGDEDALVRDWSIVPPIAIDGQTGRIVHPKKHFLQERLIR